VLYEMVTGKQAFTGNTSAVIFNAILEKEPPLPSRMNAELPAELERIITKAIEKDRAFRYQSAAELRSDLKRLKRDRESGRVSIKSTQVTTAVPSRRVGGAVILASVLLLLIAASLS
jgi:serine/threonine protein kinase